MGIRFLAVRVWFSCCFLGFHLTPAWGTLSQGRPKALATQLAALAADALQGEGTEEFVEIPSHRVAKEVHKPMVRSMVVVR